MATKAGVWIDHKQAIVVLVTDAGQEIKKFKTGTPAGSGPTHKYTPNDFIAEDSRERRLVSERKRVFDEVIEKELRRPFHGRIGLFGEEFLIAREQVLFP